MVSIQQNSSSVQNRQTYFQQSQYMSKTNNIEGEWDHNLHSNPIGFYLLPVHNQFKLPKKKRIRKNRKKQWKLLFQIKMKEIKRRTRKNRKNHLRRNYISTKNKSVSE